jgi:8-oxo-dGTP diphosphatase
MGKTTRAPILAAGGIVIRNDPKPRLAVVQRRRDKAWVLPKGKLKPNEKPIAAARREVMEETGCEVRVHEFLGLLSHPGGRGPKITHFWRMQVIDQPAGKLMRDIKAVDWLPLAAAIERLSLPHEQSFVREIGPRAVRKALKKAPLRPPIPAITQLPGDQGPPADQVPLGAPPEAAAEVRPRSQAGWNVLARLMRRLLGQNSLT